MVSLTECPGPCTARNGYPCLRAVDRRDMDSHDADCRSVVFDGFVKL